MSGKLNKEYKNVEKLFQKIPTSPKENIKKTLNEN